MTEMLSYVPADHPLNRVAPAVRSALIAAQKSLLGSEYKNAHELCARALDDLKLKLTPPSGQKQQSAEDFADRPFNELYDNFFALLVQADVPEDGAKLQAVAIAHRVHLHRAFTKPDPVLEDIKTKVASIVATFPRTAADIERGRNPGDVLDPYILAATQTLICGGDFTQAISATVAHKTLMIIEGLLGHLHEDVLGAMRGNVRAPEPRGENQELLSPDNPFPGADVVQPPLSTSIPVRFHQIKSKTGSAKGGDGKRLGDQLKLLQNTYSGEIFYDALIGNTLKGHRSRRGVEQAAPGVIVLVGEAAFKVLTRSNIGPELLLRVYQTAFRNVAAETGYQVEVMAADIVATFQKRAEQEGESFLQVILEDAVGGPPDEQDNRLYKGSKSRSKGVT